MKKLFAVSSLLFLATAASAAVSSTDASMMLIPVAGSVKGVGGQDFATDLTLVNLGNTDETLELVWIPLGGTADPQVETVAIESLQFFTLEDILAFQFATRGLGAILVRAVDGSAAIDANARIWTKPRNVDRGVVSQIIPAVVLDSWRNDSPAYIHGLRYNAGLIRASYGIVNLGATPRTFRVIVNSRGGKVEETVTVPANGTMQKAVPQTVGGDLSIYIEPTNTGGRWHAYASSVDNFAGSAWTVTATQPRVDPFRDND